MGKVLIVVDMLKGFLEPKYALYCGDEARKVIPFARQLVEKYNREGQPVLFLADNHDQDDAEFEMFPKHCVQGSEEAELIEELAGLAKLENIIPKRRYSGFFGTDLEARLAELAPEVVEVVGVCTNICVFFTVEGLRNRDYSAVVYRAGVASFDKEAHEFALKQMESVLGAKVV